MHFGEPQLSDCKMISNSKAEKEMLGNPQHLFATALFFTTLAHCTAAVQSFFLWRSKLSTLQIKTFRQAHTQVPTSLSKLRFQRNDITI